MSELDELRAKRAALAATRASAAAARADAAELQAARQALQDEEAIAAAEEKHGADDVRPVQTDLGMIIVKRPHAAIFNRYQDEAKTDTQALDKLVRPCVVHPDHAEFDRILSKLPGTLIRCGNAVAELAGVRLEDQAKK